MELAVKEALSWTFHKERKRNVEKLERWKVKYPPEWHCDGFHSDSNAWKTMGEKSFHESLALWDFPHVEKIHRVIHAKTALHTGFSTFSTISTLF